MKKIFLGLLLSIGVIGTAFAIPPTFEDQFANKLLDPAKNNTQNEQQTLYNIGIDPNKTLKENVLTLFYPQKGGRGGALWDIIRTIGFGILVLMLIVTGLDMLTNASDEKKVASQRMNFLYIFYGAFLLFGATWILGTALDFNSGSQALVDTIQNNLLFQFLSFLKAGAFFIAIIMIIYYGFQMMRAFEKEDKIKSAKAGILNVVMALAFIKLIDYIYFIAQSPTFKSQAVDLIVQVSKLMGYLLGFLFMLSVFWGGFLLVTSSGDSKAAEKAQTIIKNIFIISIVIFMFLLVAYQIFSEFA